MKVDYEIRQCDCCHDYYKPYGGKFAEYELTKNGETIHFEGYDPTNRCLVTFATTLTLDAATHGTLSDLFELNGKR